MSKRFYVLYDQRGPEDGLVLEAIGECRRLRQAIHEAGMCFDSGVIYSYRVEGEELVDERYETHLAAKTL